MRIERGVNKKMLTKNSGNKVHVNRKSENRNWLKAWQKLLILNKKRERESPSERERPI